MINEKSSNDCLNIKKICEIKELHRKNEIKEIQQLHKRNMQMFEEKIKQEEKNKCTHVHRSKDKNEIGNLELKKKLVETEKDLSDVNIVIT